MPDDTEREIMREFSDRFVARNGLANDEPSPLQAYDVGTLSYLEFWNLVSNEASQ